MFMALGKNLRSRVQGSKVLLGVQGNRDLISSSCLHRECCPKITLFQALVGIHIIYWVVVGNTGIDCARIIFPYSIQITSQVR